MGVVKTEIKIAQINCGCDKLDIVLDDRHARCFLNGVSIMASKDLDSFAPVVGMAVLASSRIPNAVFTIKANKTYGDFLKGILDTVNKSDQVKMKVLEEKPDEIAEQKPKQSAFAPKTLEEFKDGIKLANDCLFDALSLSEILLKTKLPKNVLSFKELNNTLAKVKTATNDLSKNKDKCDLIVERTGINVNRVLLAMGNNLNDLNVKRTVRESVDHVIADFMALKKILASLITSHYPLYNIDPTFKKYTDYPATWFFDPSVFYNFAERYKDASDALIDVARAESSVIRPLYAWKMKVTEE
jgi:hypothetical protein